MANLSLFNRNPHESDRDYRDHSWYVFIIISLIIILKIMMKQTYFLKMGGRAIR